MPSALLAILYLAFDRPVTRVRKAYLEAQGHGIYHLHPTRAAESAIREFTPDVVIVELGPRYSEALTAIRAVQSVPRRRGDPWPLVALEVAPEHREDLNTLSPQAVIVPQQARADRILEACFDALAAGGAR